MYVCDNTVPITQFDSSLAYEMNNPSLKQCSVSDIITNQTLLYLIAIPLYEFVIFRLFHNYILTSLKKIGIGIVIEIAAVASALFIDIYIHEGPDHTTKDQCVLLTENITNPNSMTSAAVIAVPFTLDTIAELFVYISSKRM